MRLKRQTRRELERIASRLEIKQAEDMPKATLVHAIRTMRRPTKEKKGRPAWKLAAIAISLGIPVEDTEEMTKGEMVRAIRDARRRILECLI
jgi:hypothetical protein